MRRPNKWRGGSLELELGWWPGKRSEREAALLAAYVALAEFAPPTFKVDSDDDEGWGERAF